MRAAADVSAGTMERQKGRRDMENMLVAAERKKEQGRFCYKPSQPIEAY